MWKQFGWLGGALRGLQIEVLATAPGERLSIFKTFMMLAENCRKSLLRLALPQHMHFVTPSLSKARVMCPSWISFTSTSSRPTCFTKCALLNSYHFTSVSVFGVLVFLILSLHSFSSVSIRHGPSVGMWCSQYLSFPSAFSCNHFVKYCATFVSRSFTPVAKPSVVAKPRNIKSEACSVKSSVISSISRTSPQFVSGPALFVSVDPNTFVHRLTSGCRNLRRRGSLEIDCTVARVVFLSRVSSLCYFVISSTSITPKYALFVTRNSSDLVSFLSVTSQCSGHLTIIGLLWNPCWLLFSIQTSRGCVLSSFLKSSILLHCFALLTVPSFISSVFLH